MYHTYFFLKRLSKELENTLPEARLLQCFSQEKDELVLEFYSPESQLFYIKADLKQGAGILSFPTQFQRTKSHSADLFREIIGQTVSHIRQIKNDRCFFIDFTEGYSICFKMYGPRSNLILVKDEKVVTIFNQNLKKDFEAPLPQDQELPELDFSVQNPVEAIKHRFPTFDKWMLKWVEIHLPESKAPGKFLEEMISKMETGPFFLCKTESEVFLSFFPLGEVLETVNNPLEAANRYYYYFWQVTQLLRNKARIRENLEKNIRFALQQVSQTKKQLQKLETPIYRHQADLIMAYSFQISPEMEKVQLPDFETGELIEIKLKKDLSPAENAERLYKKAKGSEWEKTEIRKRLELWEQQVFSLGKELDQLEKITTLRELKPFSQPAGKKVEEEEESLPFHRHWFQGFEIRVGKNAKANDELLRISRKDDLWFHARDTAGSHVVIPVVKNKTIPGQVKERAAEMAAYYSKAKNDSLCPVMMTERKYVRKNKSMAAGQVRVEREKTILIKPKP